MQCVTVGDFSTLGDEDSVATFGCGATSNRDLRYNQGGL